MRILLPSGGGRETALAWKFHKDGHTVITDQKANPGMREYCEVVHFDRKLPETIMQTAIQHKIDMVVIGGETLLADGIADSGEYYGIRVVGPTRQAARLETDKQFCVKCLTEAGVPVPSTDPHYHVSILTWELAHRELTFPFVIKYNGLAGGKGSFVVCREKDVGTVIEQVTELCEQQRNTYGPILIQEFISGEEMSFFVATDGKDAVFLGSAADYKEIYPGGPMTGGMGGYAPNPRLTPELYGWIMDNVVYPTIEVMRTGTSYRGILYFQLMITPDNEVYVIEINVRFGDPEAQLLMPLYDGDLAELLYATTQDGELKNHSIRLKPGQCTVGVVMASAGYPASSSSGDMIRGTGAKWLWPEELGSYLFQSGTALNDKSQLVTDGGRVLLVGGVADSFKVARAFAYTGVGRIDFPGKQYRDDIAERLITAGV